MEDSCSGEVQEMGGAKGVSTVDKALAILDTLADETNAYPMSLSELSRRLKLHRSSVYRCLVSLVRAGYIVVDPDTQRYRLGPKVTRLAHQFTRQSDVTTLARLHLLRLREATGETSYLSLLVGDVRVVVAQVEAAEEDRSSMVIGMPRPLYCGAASKAILAFAPKELVDRVLREPLTRWGPGTVTDRERLREELHSVQQLGYATSAMEMSSVSWAVCAPLLNNAGQVVGSIGVNGPLPRLNDCRREQFCQEVRRTGIALSRELGYEVRSATSL